MALPLAMAFAIASGLTPQAGLYCAIVAGFLISLFGGSRVQIGGPTGAFVVIVAGIVARYGVDGLFMCTMMAGVMLIVLGVTGMGSAVRFIPRPVVVGFTNGIAVLIASTQIRDFFGLRMASVPSEFLPRMTALAHAASTWSPAATALASSALALIIIAARVVAANPRLDSRAGRRHAGGRCPRAATSRRSDPGLAAFRAGCPALHIPQFHLAIDGGAGDAGGHGRHAGRDRVADVGDGGRSDERRSAQSERGAGRAGHRQHRLAAGRRAARHRRDRAHRDQHSLRREDASRRRDPCRDAAVDPAVRRAARPVHSAGGAGGNPDVRRLQHGRVA